MQSKSISLSTTLNCVISFIKLIYYILEGIILFCVLLKWRLHKDVSGQNVLITGAASGIGQLMAAKFAQLGCTIILWDIDADGMEKTVDLINEKCGTNVKCHCYQVNLANRDEIYETGKRVQDEIGPVEVLINNAGVVSGQCFLDNPDEKIKLTFDVNTLAHYYTIKCFLPDMIKRQRGHIVTISSVLGNLVGTKLADYCGSKFANVGMDLALRMELAQSGLSQHIKTTIVKPYLILTGMFAGVQPLSFIPPLEPEYVAHKIVTGILTEANEVIIPYYTVLAFYLWSLLPSKALVPLSVLTGTLNVMNNFVGRNSVAQTNENEKTKNDFIVHF